MSRKESCWTGPIPFTRHGAGLLAIRARACPVPRGEACRQRYDLIEIFNDDRRVGHDIAVVIKRRHHAVGIEFKVFRFELVAGEQIEFGLVECLGLGVEHEANPLAAGRLRRVIEREGHE